MSTFQDAHIQPGYYAKETSAQFNPTQLLPTLPNGNLLDLQHTVFSQLGEIEQRLEVATARIFGPVQTPTAAPANKTENVTHLSIVQDIIHRVSHISALTQQLSGIL